MIKHMFVAVAAGLVLTGCSCESSAGQAVPSAGQSATSSPDETPNGGPSATAAPTGTTGPTAELPGQPPGPSPGQQPSEAPPGQLPGTGRCTAAVLTGTVQGGNPAAGNRYAKLVVTNTGSAPCTLYGYGGFQLVAGDGTKLPTSTRRDEPPEPSLVVLAPGTTAAKNLHWGVVPTGSEPVDQPCQPEPRTAQVIPPDETQPFTVDWPFGPVCAAGTFHDSAYYQGY